MSVGIFIATGTPGENVTTAGIDCSRCRPARLRIGASTLVEVTGLRNPCRQIDGFTDGLLKQVLTSDADGTTVRRAGGAVRAGDRIVVELPPGERRPLDVV
jgi:MOSC domain-containing protein YiiM